MKYVWRIQSNALIQSIPLDLQLSLRRHPQMSHNWYSLPPSRVIDEDQQSVEKNIQRFPVAFQKEPCHYSCWKPKG